MPELETEIRDLLHERAREARPSLDAPPRVLRRARRRRTGTLALSGAVAAALIASAFVVVRALPVGEGAIVRPGGDTTWRGIWPQSSREEAAAAQEAADAGDPAFTWQLDASRVAERYAREVEGFDAASMIELGAPGRADATIWNVMDCLPNAECGGARSIQILLVQPFGSNGLWVVTRVSPGVPAEEPPPLPDPGGAKQRVRSFLRARLDGDRASLPQIVTAEALDAYEAGEGGLSLFGYEEAEIRSAEPADANAFEIVVVLRTADGAEVAERLFVGPGTSADGEARAFVIRGAMLET